MDDFTGEESGFTEGGMFNLDGHYPRSYRLKNPAVGALAKIETGHDTRQSSVYKFCQLEGHVEEDEDEDKSELITVSIDFKGR